MKTAATGRENQKTRTRRAIVAAAAKLIASGVLPTIPQAADDALVSVATAYRYFPDQLSLLSAALQDALGDVSQRFAPEVGAQHSVVDRVDAAAAGLLGRIVEREPVVRAVIALSLLRSLDGTTRRQDAAAIRPGFRHAWIAEALRPAEDAVSSDDLRRLNLALGAVMSSEALIALEDVMGVAREDAVDIIRWMARTLTSSVLCQAPAAEATP